MDWESWKQEHGKSYSEAEDAEKKRVWEATHAKVTAHNLKYDQGLVSYQLAMNKFAVEGPPLMSTPPEMPAASKAHPMATFSPYLGPSSIDYRHRGWVTSVKDQGQCGGCYAFAAVGVIEAQHKQVNGELVSLSAQQLIDCSGNAGCEGGNLLQCFQCASHGLASEADYPFVGKQGPCQSKRTTVKVNDWWHINNSEDDLMYGVANWGPAAVAIHIPSDFHVIKNTKDVYDSQEPGEGWHAVLVVGYGTNSKGVDYWIIKNSWGTGWGGGGYCLMKRGVNCCRIEDGAYLAGVHAVERSACSIL